MSSEGKYFNAYIYIIKQNVVWIFSPSTAMVILDKFDGWGYLIEFHIPAQTLNALNIFPYQLLFLYYKAERRLNFSSIYDYGDLR